MARIIDILNWGHWRRACSIALFAGLSSHASAAIHALLIGGGPDKENNTAQIEEHLRFVASLVPPSPCRIVLFADGKAGSHSLSYTDSARLSAGQRALDILLPEYGLGTKVLTRAPALGAPIDGPSRLGSIDRAFTRLAATSGRSGPPVLLYFAGHGSVAQDKRKNSVYNLWANEDLDPATLVREIDALPPRVPVTLVMAQCYSGGFANVMFKDANPSLGLNGHLIAGFFAAESDREAAGCGTDTSSPLYQDFSSYFFGALSGRDKLGRQVTGANYDGAVKVTCYEAYCYALIHDESIDTPVCTSLIFLRRYADLPDATIFSTSWSDLLESATPAQRAALDALSAKLELEGNGRLLAAYDRLMFSDPVGQLSQIRAYREAQDRLNSLRMESLHSLFDRWPSLRWKDSHDYEKAARGAAADLEKDRPLCEEILRTDDRFTRADLALDQQEALLVRLTDLAEAVLRLRELRQHGAPAIKARFEALWQAEQRPLGIVP